MRLVTIHLHAIDTISNAIKAKTLGIMSVGRRNGQIGQPILHLKGATLLGSPIEAQALLGGVIIIGQLIILVTCLGLEFAPPPDRPRTSL